MWLHIMFGGDGIWVRICVPSFFPFCSGSSFDYIVPFLHFFFKVMHDYIAVGRYSRVFSYSNCSYSLMNFL